MRRIGNRAVSWLVVAVTAMLSPVSMSFAAQNGPNTVNSAAIIAADGTSGQTLTTGNGIKTGHIQDGAVTTAKIVDFSVTNSKIVDGAVTSTKIGAGAVGTANIADGAVTDAKITGPISGAKISGTLGVEKLGVYAGTKVVHKGAADGVNTFNSVVAALNAIGPTTEPYAIIVMPGVYEEDFGGYNSNNAINIDIIGQSRTGSILKAVGTTCPGLPYYYIDMPSSMSFTNLTFQGFIYISRANNRITNCIVVGGRGIHFQYDATNIVVENVDILSTEIGIGSYDLHAGDTISLNNVKIDMQGIPGTIGMHLREAYGKPVKLSNIAIKGAGVGIQPYVGAFNIDNMTITDSAVGFSTSYFGSNPGLWSILNITNSKFDVPANEVIGTYQDIRLENSIVRGLVVTGTVIRIGNTRLLGTFSGGGTTTVVNSYDENFTSIPNGVY